MRYESKFIIEKERIRVIKIMFLTNNLRVTRPLLEWLRSEGNDVMLVQEPINLELLKPFSPAWIISYNYSNKVPAEVIKSMPFRIINLHTSYLPYNRGADPLIWSLIDGTIKGVTIHYIDEGIDTGDIIVQQEIDFDYDNDSLETAYSQAHEKIQNLFFSQWQNIKEDMISSIAQKGYGTTHKKNDLIITPDYKKKIREFIEFYKKTCTI